MNETDTETRQNLDPNLVGIGGWLILQAIGLVFGVIVSVVFLVLSLFLLSRANSWHTGYFFISICLQIGLLAYILIAANRFFRKKKSAPGTMIILLFANLACSAIFFLIALANEPYKSASGEIRDLALAAINAAIWIPYYRVSQRVKVTFTA